MDGRITINQILFTLVLGGTVALFGVMKVAAERKIELEKAKEEAGQTLDKLLDSLEDALKGINTEESEPNIPAPEWETITMNVSAYCPREICCEDFADGTTASGHKIKPGDVFVAAPHKYPFGTEMMIPGYADGKVVEVKDIGGAIKGNRLDVFFATHQEALEFGRIEQHPVKVKI